MCLQTRWPLNWMDSPKYPFYGYSELPVDRIGASHPNGAFQPYIPDFEPESFALGFSSPRTAL